MPQNTTAQVQSALKALGFDPGVIDGIPGRRTDAAVKAYQKSRGLVVDGVVGVNTRAALAADGHPIRERDALDPPPSAPWLVEAERFLGLKEVAGDPSNPTIMAWAARIGPKALGIPYTGDDIPWCGLFVAHCVAATLCAEPLPAIAVRAKAWLDFGQAAPVEAPPFGAIGVFDRSGGGHVGFLVGQEGSKLYVCGGNQSNSVSVMTLERSRLIGARWPRTVALSTQPLPRLRGGKLSTNEA